MRLSRFPHQHRDRDIRPLELEGVKLAGGLHGLHLGLVLIEASPQIHQLLLLLLAHLQSAVPIFYMYNERCQVSRVTILHRGIWSARWENTEGKKRNEKASHLEAVKVFEFLGLAFFLLVLGVGGAGGAGAPLLVHPPGLRPQSNKIVMQR